MNQIELHKKIDALIASSPATLRKEEVSSLILINKDVQQYFFTKADERWLAWLWENSFLDVIKKRAEDPTRYAYQTPEINYLVKVSEKEPAKVVDIMLAVPVSEATFNPEVIDRFLSICSTLPAEQLARMVQKIRNDKWVHLMSPFNRLGFEYEKMLQILSDAKDDKSILILSEAMLAVRPKEEVDNTASQISSGKPFYLDDLSRTKIFELLANVENGYIEQALTLATKVMAQIISLGDEAEEGSVFPVKETFHLFDVNFFTLQPGAKESLSHQDDVHELAAVVKVLASRLIGERCGETEVVQKLYRQYIEPLPKSRAMWRLRLFILSLCPQAFSAELKDAFFSLFEAVDVKHYHEIIGGAEYDEALRRGFSALSEDDRDVYVKRIVEYFKKHAENAKDEEEKDWHMRYGSRILSMLLGHLTPDQDLLIKKEGFEPNPNYEPAPSIALGNAEFIQPRGPITQEEFAKLTVTEIAQKLRDEWTPDQLSKQNDSEDFFNPRNAEGAGELLRTDIPRRLQDYINEANLFFDRGVLDEHYTYSFLRGVQEALQEGKTEVALDWDKLIALCNTIKISGDGKPFNTETRKRESFGWLSGWTGVHSAMGDVIQGLVSERNGKLVIDFQKHRDKLFGITGYLLTYPDPVPADETEQSGDPYTMAINTVRGRAFQAFALFVYQDGKRFGKEEESRISPDVKELYEKVLKSETTRALMFMFGHYLPSFYYRDIAWTEGTLAEIFPQDHPKKNLYLAAWEGYLAANLYREIFGNPKFIELYERAIDFSSQDYTKRSYFKDLDEGLADHLALAFTYFENFGLKADLFQRFWATKNTKRHKEFVSFLGRHCISRENAKIIIEANKLDIEKLKSFWDWMLENDNEIEVLSGFGFWINPNETVFDTKWLAERVRRTLAITKGKIEWGYSVAQNLELFAKEAPEDTLEILRAYLTNQTDQKQWFYIGDELLKVFTILYENPETKDATYKLINDLLPIGGGRFWGLKAVLQ